MPRPALPVGDRAVTTLREDFADDVVATERGGLSGPELLPERLARACAHVLPVDGASISMVFAPDRRLPLGASGEFAATAERLQFTVGEGPCLEAQATSTPVVATEADLRERWPAYFAELTARTPVRSVVSLPLRGGLTGIGALDLFFTPPNDLRVLRLADALVVAQEVTASLAAPGGPDERGEYGPAWLDAPDAARRSRVWQAIGFLNVGMQLPSPDALAVLRAYAYARERLVDDVAAALLAGEVTLADLAMEGRSSS